MFDFQVKFEDNILERKQTRNMKRKISYFLLAILLLPVFALFGCDEPASYSFSVVPSWASSGSVEGSGSFTEDDIVTLTATANSKSSFVAWVYQNTTLLVDGDTYSIKNTKNSDNKITQSTLTFSSKKETSGSYTAVFDESKLAYAKLASWKVTDDPTKPSDEDNSAKTKIMDVGLNITQGRTTLVESYNIDPVEVKENVEISTPTVTEVLKLDPDDSQQIVVEANVTYNNASSTRTFRANLLFHTNEVTGTTKDGEYKISYADGIYTMSFEFKVSADKSYFLVLYYKNINL